MSVYLLKFLISLVFLLSAIIAAFSMLSLMGRPEKKSSPASLRKVHRMAGFALFLILVPLAFMGIYFVARSGDQLSLRAVLHGTLALFLVVIILIKILIVRFFKLFLKFVPVMGLMVFSLTLVVFSMSAGYYFVRAVWAPEKPTVSTSPAQPISEGNTTRGEALFKTLCSGCHHLDRQVGGIGPGLKRINETRIFPSSMRSSTLENFIRQLRTPLRNMPPFLQLDDRETADLWAYLKSL